MPTSTAIDALEAYRVELVGAMPLVEHPVVQARIKGEFWGGPRPAL